MLDEIRSELSRVNAKSVRITMDPEFEPKVGDLLKVELEGAYWHLLPVDFLELVKKVRDNAGSEAVKTAIEKKGQKVWHGPAPRGSGDDAP